MYSDQFIGAINFTAIASFFGILTMFYTKKRYKNTISGLQDFMMYYVYNFIAIVLIFFRNEIGIFFGVLVPNVLYIFGSFVLLKGLRGFYKSTLSNFIAITLCTIFVLLNILNIYVAPDNKALIIWYIMGVVGIHTAILITIFRNRSVSNSAKYFMVPLSLLIIFTQFMRLLFLILFSKNENYFSYGNGDDFFVLMNGILSIFLIIGLLLMINDLYIKEINDVHKDVDVFTQIYENTPIAILIMKKDGTILHANQSFCYLFYESIDNILRFNWIERSEKYNVKDQILLYLNQLTSEQRSVRFQSEIVNKVNKKIPLEIIMQLIIDEQTEEELYYEVYINDLTLIRKTENDLHETQKQMINLLQNIPGFAYHANVIGPVGTKWEFEILSNGFKRVTGFETYEKLNGKDIDFRQLILPKYSDDINHKWEIAIKKRIPYVNEYQIRTKNEDIIWVWEQGVTICDDNNKLIAVEGYITNINQRKILEQKLALFSYQDSLTGLYNRRYADEKFEEIDLEQNLPISVIVGDLNGLKFANDNYGHDVGDDLLLQTANVLKKVFRKDDIISRYGGDEFLVLLPRVSDETCSKLVSRLRAEISNVDYTRIDLSISLGYGTKNNKSENLYNIYNEAEIMMYIDKNDNSEYSR